MSSEEIAGHCPVAAAPPHLKIPSLEGWPVRLKRTGRGGFSVFRPISRASENAVPFSRLLPAAAPGSFSRKQAALPKAEPKALKG